MSSPTESTFRNIESLLRALNGALRVAQLYPRGHQTIADSLEKAEESLTSLLRSDDRVGMGILETEVVFGDRAVYRTAQYAGYFVKVLRQHGVDRITFMSGCSQNDLGELVDVLQLDVDSVMTMGGIQKAIRARGVRCILLESLATPELMKKSDQSSSPADDVVVLPQSLLVQARSGIDELMDNVTQQKPILVDPAKAYVYELTQSLVDGQSPLMSLAMLERHEDGWLKRLVRVSTLAVAFARQIGLSQRDIEQLGTASFLYDIGLLSLGVHRGEIADDDAIFREHPVEGARILLSGKNVDKLSVIVALEHHMRHDLSGFPKISGKKRIHPVAELIGLVDSFVDLVTSREGRESMRSDQAILELYGYVGKRYGIDLFSRFVGMTRIFSPGVLVQLKDGRIGIVIRSNALDTLRPVVRLKWSSDGVRLPGPEDMDLARDPSKPTILRVVDPVHVSLEPAP